MIASIDFESRSAIPLRKTGVYPYAEHVTTDLWCMAWSIDGGEPALWVPGDTFPDALREATEFRAWNCQFERVMWHTIGVKRYGFPVVPLERWYCTAAEAAAMALPRSLDQCATVLSVDQQKDMVGHRLMLQMCRPRSRKGRGYLWWDDPYRVQRLGEYCKGDVRTEQAVYRAVRRLDPQERQVFLLDQKINDRGILLDVPLVHAAKAVAQESLDRANKEVTEATGGAITSVTQTGKLAHWLGVNSVRKSAVQEMLEGGLASPARRALEARAEAGRTSISKLDTMLQVQCADNRVRGLLLYHGASTGRWTGRLVQPHNFPRGDVVGATRFIPTVLAQDYELLSAVGCPSAIVSSLLRGCLHASPGCRFISGDYSQIEARVVNWLAGQSDVVAEFAKPDNRVYETMAAKIYGVSAADITKGDPRRQLGKAVELACGFQMGAETFRAEAKNTYGVTLPLVVYDGDGHVVEDFSADVVALYRKTHPLVTQLWRDLQEAALRATRQPGAVFEVRACCFSRRGGYLWLVLPSGRALAYASPTIEDRPVPWDETGRETRPSVIVWGRQSMTQKWARRVLYGGLLAENVVQALARDVMSSGMMRLEAAGYPIVLSVHDEILCDVPDTHGSEVEFQALMTQVPSWASGLPVAGDVWSGDRYRK